MVAALLGAAVGWILDPGLSSQASQLFDELNSGVLMRDVANSLEPLVPLLVAVGPFTAQTLCALALALVLGVVVRSRGLFGRRERIVALGLVAVTMLVVRNDLGDLVALSLGLAAVSIALSANIWLQFGVVVGLLAAGCLATADLIPAALLVICATGAIVGARSSHSVGTTVLLAVVISAFGVRMARWLGGDSIVDVFQAISALPALLLAVTLIVPLVLVSRDMNSVLAGVRSRYVTRAET